jgi:hypothetical protein
MMVFMVTTQLEGLHPKKILGTISSVSQISSAILSGIVIIYCFKFNAGAYTYFTPIANYVLDKAPALYNPLPSTFASRTLHVDGGYAHAMWRPIVYTNNDSYVRKILIPKGMERQAVEGITGNGEHMDMLESIIMKESVRGGKKEYEYINIPKWCLLRIAPPTTFDPLQMNDLAENNSGVWGWENTFHWFSPNAVVELKAGDSVTRGLEFDFSAAYRLDMLNGDETPYLSVAINGEHVLGVEMAPGQDYNLKILAEDLPEPDDFGLFTIEFASNFKYNPFEAGDSGDDRDLSIAVTYIGAPRQYQ